jgi:hypothetical protein
MRGTGAGPVACVTAANPGVHVNARRTASGREGCVECVAWRPAQPHPLQDLDKELERGAGDYFDWPVLMR